MECVPEGDGVAGECVVGEDVAVGAEECVVVCGGDVVAAAGVAVVVAESEYWRLRIHCCICESFGLKDV